MTRFLALLTFLLCLLTSCSQNGESLILKFESVDGLGAEAEVVTNGFKIGQVRQLTLGSDQSVLVEIELNPDIEIPKDSKFVLSNADLLGTKEIDVEFGQSNFFFANNDTAFATSEPSLFDGEVKMIQLKDLLETVTGQKKRDSILTELKRLNANLEELKNDTN